MFRKLSFLLAFCFVLLVLTNCAAPQEAQNAVPDQTEATAVEISVATAISPLSPETRASTPTVVAMNTRPEPLATGPLMLITLGDSLTEGQGDSDTGGGYPGRLLAKLRAVRPGSQLVNLGHSGWTSDDLIAGNQDTPSELVQALDAVKKARSAGQSSLALVWIGSNDLWYLYEYAAHPIPVEAEPQDQDRYRKNIDQILGSLRQAGAQVLVALLDDQSRRPVVAVPADPNNRAFTNITADDLRRMSAQVKAYNAVLREAAARNGASVVDFYATDIFVKPATLAEDGNHPNEKGYDQIANIWWQALARFSLK